MHILCLAHSYLRLADHTLCLDQLYGVTVVLVSSLCTHVPHFVVTSAHTLLGPDILMFRLVEYTLCLDQLYSCTVIMLLCVHLYDILLLLVHTFCLAQMFEGDFADTFSEKCQLMSMGGLSEGLGCADP